MKHTLSDEEIASVPHRSVGDPLVRRLRGALGQLGATTGRRLPNSLRLSPSLQKRLRISDAARFWARSWERAPTVGRGSPGDFDDLFSIAILDRIVATRQMPWHAVRIEGRQHGSRQRTLDSFDQVPDLSAMSLYLHNVDHHWAPLRALCSEMEACFDRPATCFGFLTPPNEQTRELHWDSFDVFVLQISGKKLWRLYDEVIHLPVDGQQSRDYEIPSSSLSLKTELGAGDVLYIPRGVPHEAETSDSHSLHISLSLRTVSWHQLVAETWQRSLRVAACATTPEPARQLERVLDSLPQQNPARIAEDVSFFPRGIRSPAAMRYQSGDLLMRQTRSAKIAQPRQTYVALGRRHVLRRTPAGHQLIFAEHRVLVDTSAIGELAYLLAHPRFSLADCPPSLDLQYLAWLADELVARGFLARRLEPSPRPHGTKRT